MQLFDTIIMGVLVLLLGYSVFERRRLWRLCDFKDAQLEIREAVIKTQEKTIKVLEIGLEMERQRSRKYTSEAEQ